MLTQPYVEPLTVESVTAIIEKEKPDALLPTLGGQTGLNLSLELNEAGVLAANGVEMIGAKPAAIKKGEDRELFKQAMLDIGLDVARSYSVNSLEEAQSHLDDLGDFPIILRPAYTLGGTGGGIAYNREEFDQMMRLGLEASPISRSLDGGMPAGLERVRDGSDARLQGSVRRDLLHRKF